MSNTRHTLIFATNNAHKVAEIQSSVGDQIKVISLKQAGINIDIPEPHDTLEANAREKSTTIYQLTGTDCFSEDSGLEVHALGGAPGVKSARYAGENRSDADNIRLLLQNLANLTNSNSIETSQNNPGTETKPNSNPNRKAQFRTVISLLLDGQEHQFTGICEGHILNAPTGNGGFGYDPIFVPDGETRSFAQMSMEEKNKYSHRRKAADQLIRFLRSVAAIHPDSNNSLK